MKPYALLSDVHCHSWSAFGTTLPTGVNSRLQVILDEMVRAAGELVEAGGDTMVFAGDLFHVRGSVDPEVFNPVFELFKRLTGMGIKILMIPGNHDLKGNETTELGNAVQTLGHLPGVTVATKPSFHAFEGQQVAMVPWHPTVKATRAAILALRDTIGHSSSAIYDLVIHAPMNGVIKGLPDLGFDPAELAMLGFNRVFAGHYHHHVETATQVWSVGATTHQTWSDVGTKAGFLLVYGDCVEWRASHAPAFVEITHETDEDEVPLLVDGNFVRVRLETTTPAEEKKLRAELLEMGAKGVVIQTSRAPLVSRSGATVKAGSSLEVSVGGYVKKLAHPREAELGALCEEILAEARAA